MTDATFSLKDTVAIVTGAGQGIGQAIAIKFAQYGANVLCVARTQSDLDNTCEQINALENAGRAVSCVADVLSASDREKVVNSALETFGKVTHLVNTVGGGGPNTPESLPYDRLTGMFDYNVTSSYHLMQLCLKPMREAGSGNIINISSAAGKLIQRNFSGYAMAKAALDHLTRNFAQDVAPIIRVNAVAPGPIATAALRKAAPEEALQYMAKHTPMQRIGLVDDIANAALFFASPASAWITGQILAVDGGAEQPIFPG